MTKFIAVFFAVSPAVSPANAQNNQIVSGKNFKQALADARQSNKPVLPNFTATDCRACQEYGHAVLGR